MTTAREDTMKAVGNLQLCAGQQAGSEAAVHAAKEIFADKECEAVLLIDASNVFNTLNRQAMMHNISVPNPSNLCKKKTTKKKQTYEIAPRLFVAKNLELKSEEGTTQGDPIAMAAYALSLSVLQSKISQNNTGAKHIANADDFVGAGKLQEIKNLWNEICKHRPPLEHNPNATKSCLVVKEEMKDLAVDIFKDIGITITTEGQKHLGTIIGSPEFKRIFTKNLVDKWVLELQELSKIAKTEPHTAYSNFVFSFKMKWNYYLRTIPNLSDHLQPLEDVISNNFVPSLFGSKVKDLVRRLTALPPKLGGMGITNPIEITNDEYENSIRLTQNLTVTQPLYESRMNWIHDPAPPASCCPNLEFAGTPAPTIAKEFPGALSTQPRQKKSRRRRRRRNNHSANQNSAHRSTAPVTPDERWTN